MGIAAGERFDFGVFYSMGWRSLLLLSLLLPVGFGTEDVAPVPDPAGLGERLALIDYLQSHGQSVTPGAPLSDLRLAYRLLLHPPSSTATGEREQAVLRLWREYNETPAEGATLEEITHRLQVLAAQATSSQSAEQRREAADARAPAVQPPAAPVAARLDQPQDTDQQHDTATVTDHVPTTAPQAKVVLADIREVTRPADMGTQVHAYLISPSLSPILIVVLDPDVREPVETILRRWPAAGRHDAGIDATVIIHGHSSGSYFNPGVLTHAGAVGGDLAEHLRRNREYYETLAGSRERKTIDFAVMTGCNPSGCNQEAELRDGFGYRPLHRVFTAPGCVDDALVVLPAIIQTGSTLYTSSTPFHASFTWYQPMVIDGKTCSISCYAAIDDQALDIKEHVHAFTVNPSGVTETTKP